MPQYLTFTNSFGSNLNIYFAYYDNNNNIIQTGTMNINVNESYTQMSKDGNNLELIYLDSFNNYGLFQILNLTGPNQRSNINLTSTAVSQSSVKLSANINVGVLINNINAYISPISITGYVQIGTSSDSIWVDNASLTIYLQNNANSVAVPTTTPYYKTWQFWLFALFFASIIIFITILITILVTRSVINKDLHECLLNSSDEYWEKIVKSENYRKDWKRALKLDREDYLYNGLANAEKENE